MQPALKMGWRDPKLQLLLLNALTSFNGAALLSALGRAKLLNYHAKDGIFPQFIDQDIVS